MDSEIKRCPICGGRPRVVKKYLVTHIVCADCGYRVLRADRDIAIKDWNKEPDCGESCTIK